MIVNVYVKKQNKYELKERYEYDNYFVRDLTLEEFYDKMKSRYKKCFVKVELVDSKEKTK